MAFALAALPALACAAEKNETMKINVIAGDVVMPATLDNSAAARDFASLLPLELTLTDYHGTEKVADLNRTLDALDAPDSYKPAAGDITQYAPWQNLAIFIKPFSAARGLVRLGAFDGDYLALKTPGNVAVRIELAD
ncbi:cyclophilin-like fold protein [Donghicola mangrovi]|nr:cyclophilin-like fold protein [Donghicola mangrovi]